ncbi:4-coumarate-CoA ligase 2 [Mucor mucedo]|uniref:4-coumarate-CoA ligase 2 n=1 Tax=Mucor mucedo TaxID=29922 RepID=UPI00221FFC17|nr:4-coumarate-CoA ligase 2 [Mucor mucedo]KAI7890689.1 4-coumarate-CoA ligase 2 [Mucor mucedo]
MASTEREYGYTNLVDLVLSNDRKVSDNHPIYIDGSTEETLSFGELKQLVGKATAGLMNLGLKKGDSLCLYTPNNISVPPIVLATLAAGGSICPSNPLFTVFELEKMLVISRSKYIIAHPINIDSALQAARTVGISESNVWSICDDPKGRVKNWREMVLNISKTASPCQFTLEESKSTLAYICFSSGTTGPPKGVMISHHNFISSTVALNNAIKSSSEVNNSGPLLAVVPLFHILGIFRFLHLSVLEGRTTVLMARYDLEEFCATVQKFKVTSLYVVPPMLLQLLNSPAIVDKYDFSSVKGFHAGAAPVSMELSRQIAKRFNTPVLQGYGMTETSSVLTYQTVENYAPGSVGRMLDDMQTKVVDENGKELPIGDRGEICVKGPIVMQGYLHNPSATAEVIDKDGYLHTGDIGYEDKHGNWYIVDRSKELIKYNAYQIAPAELENVLLECPLVSDAAVIGIYDEKNETEVPRAYVTLGPSGKKLDTKVAEAEIHRYVNGKVTPYKRLRGGIVFIDVVPKSVSGKILRKDLRELFKTESKITQSKL